MSNLKFPLETSRSISKIFTPLCLLALMGLAAFIRGYDLDRYYFTGDEALHLILAKIFDGDWVSFCTRESHPPFYYILLKKYMEVFGVESRLGLRLISLISGVMTVGVGFLVAHRISANRCVGLLGAFLLVTAPLLIDQSQQLRGYALLILLLFVLVFLLIKREFSWLTLMTSILVTGLACSTHYSAAVFIGATFLVGNLRIYESILNRKKLALIIWNGSHLCFFLGVYYLGSRYPVPMKDTHVGPPNATGGQKIIETLFDVSERFFLSTGSKIPWLFAVIIIIGIIVLVKTKRLSLLLLTTV
ncbi:MAG: glycosyltransferase family 39 protein, partial [Proteobacteria bacterium]|nr:glycosyltransferase family 39 protein [Pseudomonadota bacterium]